MMQHLPPKQSRQFGVKYRRRAQAVSRAALEALEDRRLLAVTASLSTGRLTVSGDSGNNIISILTASGTLSVNADGSTIYSNSESAITEILVHGNDGNDSIEVQTNVSASINATLNGNAGNDTLKGGAGDDSLDGGSGNDTYRFWGSSSLGSDYVKEDPIIGTDNSVDTLDFAGLGSGVRAPYHGRGSGLDIGSTLLQTDVVSQKLDLQFSSATGIDDLLGSPYDDNFIGNSRNNRMEGRAGIDKLYAGDGNDTVDGGEGNSDCVHGEGGNDLEYGGPGNNDYVGHDYFGSGGFDDSGNDTLYGGPGNDSMGGDSGSDLIYGDDGSTADGNVGGNDRIYGGSEADTIYGGGGNDSIEGGLENDLIYGDFASLNAGFGEVDEGEDTIFGNDGNDTIRGDSSGADYGYGNGNDSLDGGAGNDSVTGDGGSGSGYWILGDDTIVGGPGDDTLTGEDGNDRYRFAAGSLDSLGTDYIVEAGSAVVSLGRDTLEFSGLVLPSGVTYALVYLSYTSTQTVTTGQLSLLLSASDSIEDAIGSAYKDILNGNLLDNVLTGGLDDDTISGAWGFDTINGESGNDEVVGGESSDTVDGGDGDDTVDGRDGNDVLYGGAGNDTLVGYANNDTLYGGDGDDDLDGGSGNDVMYGDEGDDVFRALDGARDTLWGGNHVFGDTVISRDNGPTIFDVLNEMP